MSLPRTPPVLSRKPIPFEEAIRDMEVEKVRGEEDRTFVEKIRKDVGDDKFRKSITTGLQKQLSTKSQDKEKEDKKVKEERKEDKKEKEKEKRESKKRESQVEKEKDREKKKKAQQIRESFSGKDKNNDLVAGFEISTPFNVQHKVHVDFDYKWTGQDPDIVFELTQKLGEGAYGAVYKAKHRESKFIIAIKVISTQEEAISDIEKEINILKQCKSSNIVSYYGTCIKDQQLWILMDYCGLGSMRDMIETVNRSLDEEQIAYVVQGALKGLSYLHANNIIHRDVKAANILLTEDATIKIADFGVSAQLDSAMKLSEQIGTPLWMAPEVLQHQKYDSKCDIWSLGITCIELGDGYPPNHDVHPLRAMRLIPTGPPPTFKKPEKWSSALLDFVSKCLTKDPHSRPSAVDLLMHPFIQKSKGADVLKKLIDNCLSIKAEKLKKEVKEKESHSVILHNDNGSNASDDILLDDGGFSTMIVKDDEEETDIFSTTVIHESSTPEYLTSILGPAKAHEHSNSYLSEVEASKFATIITSEISTQLAQFKSEIKMELEEFRESLKSITDMLRMLQQQQTAQSSLPQPRKSSPIKLTTASRSPSLSDMFFIRSYDTSDEDSPKAYRRRKPSEDDSPSSENGTSNDKNKPTVIAASLTSSKSTSSPTLIAGAISTKRGDSPLRQRSGSLNALKTTPLSCSTDTHEMPQLPPIHEMHSTTQDTHHSPFQLPHSHKPLIQQLAFRAKGVPMRSTDPPDQVEVLPSTPPPAHSQNEGTASCDVPQHIPTLVPPLPVSTEIISASSAPTTPAASVTPRVLSTSTPSTPVLNKRPAVPPRSASNRPSVVNPQEPSIHDTEYLKVSTEISHTLEHPPVCSTPSSSSSLPSLSPSPTPDSTPLPLLLSPRNQATQHLASPIASGTTRPLTTPPRRAVTSISSPNIMSSPKSAPSTPNVPTPSTPKTPLQRVTSTPSKNGVPTQDTTVPTSENAPALNIKDRIKLFQ